jgi:hypothetical protein
MKRFRSWFRGGDEPPPDTATAAGGSLPGEVAEDEAARELRLQREFYSSLSEVARHELRFQDYAPEAPSQINRTGRWLTAELTDARDDAGLAIVLEADTELEYVGRQGDAESGPTVRFLTTDGRQVTIAAPSGDEWPASVVRASELGTEGGG